MTTVLSAHIEGMLDPFGFHFSNGCKLMAVVDQYPDVGPYRHIDNHWFYAEKDGWAKGLSHSGSDQNEGGFGGGVRILPMEDGSERTIIGPWYSTPRGTGIPDLIEVSLKLEKDSIYTFGFHATIPKVLEILKLVKIPNDPDRMFRAVLFKNMNSKLELSRYDFAVIKNTYWMDNVNFLSTEE